MTTTYHIPFTVVARFSACLAIVLALVIQNVAVAAPMTGEQLDTLKRGSDWYTTEAIAGCSSAAPAAGAAAGAGTNLDYTGKEIFSKVHLAEIAKHEPFYKIAATAADIPWQMIAVIHMRETTLGRTNPGNGQGIYQFVDRRGGPYPSGPVSDTEFQRQTTLAAEFIKGKASANYAANRTLGASATPEAIKDTFFSYNGRSSKYEQQATQFGFSATTQGYEGSPYVMNKADANRDPAVNTTTWGQVKVDFGPIEYPANNDYGAFVYYAALTGLSIGGCTSSAGGLDKVLEIVKAEFAKGVKEEPLGSNSGPVVDIYTSNNAQPWCGYFLSWAFKEAGIPFAENNGVMAAVDSYKPYAEKLGFYHPRGEQGFVPQPGDIVIYDEGLSPFPSHVNIVISYNPTTGKYTSIGGNESEKVSQGEYSATDPSITGYMRITQ